MMESGLGTIETDMVFRFGLMALNTRVNYEQFYKKKEKKNQANKKSVFIQLSNSAMIFLLGEWKHNKAQGKGKFWHVDGDIYEGRNL